MTEVMTGAAREYSRADGLEERALNQMARELLLAQSSDWAFIMKTGTFAEYAQARTKEHINRFFELHAGLKQGNINSKILTKAEHKYNLFKNIDYHVFMNEDDIESKN
jgi:1,4-alpha-glucan branching enzyme